MNSKYLVTAAFFVLFQLTEVVYGQTQSNMACKVQFIRKGGVEFGSCHFDQKDAKDCSSAKEYINARMRCSHMIKEHECYYKFKRCDDLLSKFFDICFYLGSSLIDTKEFLRGKCTPNSSY